MKNKIRVGIFLGGSSREREISFAGGRTVYDNLDKGLFEAIPIFVDSFHNFIQLNWRYLYQGSIRDFYPASDIATGSKYQIYIDSLAGDISSDKLEQHIQKIGTKISPEQLKHTVDFAFLCLHGPWGEDGTIQGFLEWYQIPYSGSSILGAAVGIDKIIQKKWMQQFGYLVNPYRVIDRSFWEKTTEKDTIFKELIHSLGLPLVIKSPRQGSSIGVNIIHQRDLPYFIKSVNTSFFIEQVTYEQWHKFSTQEKESWIASLIDLRSGIGLPIEINGHIIYQPEALLIYLEEYFLVYQEPVNLASPSGEKSVLIESFIPGREFSCIVLQIAGNEPVALSPTEMLKEDMHFDYRAKYLPGLIRKETPMRLPVIDLKRIKEDCIKLFQDLDFQVYARIDGIITPHNKIYLNDPNTTAGMNPSSFLFHQAAEIGLNPTQLLTFLIRNSIAERIASYKFNFKNSIDMLQMIDKYTINKVRNN